MRLSSLQNSFEYAINQFSFKKKSILQKLYDTGLNSVIFILVILPS
ncbi:hypothetical protein SAMN04515667_1081 [Formosa sp. Hel1_31_208]|nr:hypothetical protein SAMN04515667_1081 [Formosa sp. Hel1_31_208]